MLSAGANASTLTLNNASTYSGGTFLLGGPVAINNNTALGSGAVTFAGGTLNAAIELNNVNNTLNLPNTTATIIGSNNINFTGTVNLTGRRHVAVTNTAVTTFSGQITGPEHCLRPALPATWYSPALPTTTPAALTSLPATSSSATPVPSAAAPSCSAAALCSAPVR